MQPSDATVILPVKDEPYLHQLLNDICESESYKEILVQTEQGLGYAVMQGVKKATGKCCVILDSDGSHDPKTIPTMINLSEEYDIVIGSRYNGGHTEDSFTRETISRIYCKLAQLLFNLTIKDNMSGFIVAKKEVFETYPINNKGFKFGLELLVRSKNEYKATEYPITFKKRKMGKSKASPIEAINTLKFMVKLWVETR